MPSCFVMQPFDGDKFDKRYKDVFAPAIKAAGLDPYRVDQDPRVEVPIEDIERGIREADVCFAEITTDNPNVWFELGYAIALNKPVCMVCSKERDKAFPFDVRHRLILPYSVGSPSDFQDLSTRITVRLQALLQQERTEKGIAGLQPQTATHGLSPHEATALAIVVARSVEEPLSFYLLKNAMERAGFNDFAAGLAVRSLAKKKMIESRECYDPQAQDNYNGYYATDTGEDWMLTHHAELNFRMSVDPTGNRDIPF